MTDRELLEAAAKAAGINSWADASSAFGLYVRGQWWNPLTSDGDALRLAVTLNIDVHQRMTTPREVWAQAPMQRTIIEPALDRLSATRRAVVKAAAEIGSKT